jgi:hypothetical protein
MDSFYMIVLSIALVFLIIALSFFGIMMSKSNSTVVFPPTKNTCPDYWTTTQSADGTKTYCKPNGINTGELGMDSAPGRDAQTGAIDFSDAGWSSKYNKTNICALNTWTNKNKVSWDGVSNFNGC